MKMTIIPIVIGAFGTVTKGLLKELEDLEVKGQVETIQNTTLLRTAEMLELKANPSRLGEELKCGKYQHIQQTCP